MCWGKCIRKNERSQISALSAGSAALTLSVLIGSVVVVDKDSVHFVGITQQRFDLVGFNSGAGAVENDVAGMAFDGDAGFAFEIF